MVARRLRWVALPLAGLTACSTAYLPRAGKRVAVTMKGGSIELVRDGKTYSAGGLFPGDVGAAVAGNPAAEREMETFRNQRMAGAWLGLGSFAVLGADIGYIAAKRDDASGAVHWSLLGGFLLLNLVAVAFYGSAQTHLFDAVNMYNDGVDAAASP